MVDKTLYLLRHAKSSWKDMSLDDAERPLAKRGRRAGALMGRYLATEGLRPDLILCSVAKRTRQTTKLVLKELGADIPVRFEEDLYMASPREMVFLLRHVAETAESVMVVAHNPGTESLAHDLIGDGDESSLARMGEKFPTAALAVLTFPGRWRDITPACARLERYVAPRDLEGQDLNL